MSTRGTITYEDDVFHFYEEAFDDENVYIELTDPIFDVETYEFGDNWDKKRQKLTVRIPIELLEKVIEAWKKVKK